MEEAETDRTPTSGLTIKSLPALVTGKGVTTIEPPYVQAFHICGSDNGLSLVMFSSRTHLQRLGLRSP